MADDIADRITYLAGLSLGQASESTGFAVLERRKAKTAAGRWSEAEYAVRHLVRFPPGMPYAGVVEELKVLFATPPLKGAVLLVNQTVVGRSVFDLFRLGVPGASVRGLAVTAGHAAGKDDKGGLLVPKKDLVGVLQVLLQGKRLKVAPALSFAATLAEELQQFRLKAVPLTDAAVEWRERPHDDLVLAVAVAAWQGERHTPFLFALIDHGPPVQARWLPSDWSP